MLIVNCLLHNPHGVFEMSTLSIEPHGTIIECCSGLRTGLLHNSLLRFDPRQEHMR